MILTRIVDVKITNQNFDYYINLGYDVNLGEIITIPVELLQSGSNYKLDIQCDNCGEVKTIIFKNYLKYKNKWNEYTCRRCSEDKRKSSLKESFGVEYPLQNKEIGERVRKNIKNDEEPTTR